MVYQTLLSLLLTLLCAVIAAPVFASVSYTHLHNNANVLALGALVTGPGLALEIVAIFLDTPFSEEERHSRRVSQLEEE